MMSLLNYENHFLAGHRFNTVLTQAGPKPTDNFSNQEHMWKLLFQGRPCMVHLFGPRGGL